MNEACYFTMDLSSVWYGASGSKFGGVLINGSVLPIDIMLGKQNGLVFWY